MRDLLLFVHPGSMVKVILYMCVFNKKVLLVAKVVIFMKWGVFCDKFYDSIFHCPMVNSPTWVIQVVTFLSVENSNATCDTIGKLCYPIGLR